MSVQILVLTELIVQVFDILVLIMSGKKIEERYLVTDVLDQYSFVPADPIMEKKARKHRETLLFEISAVDDDTKTSDQIKK